ncbi:UNVERIFIED_CONTAM: hypothetical protein K2H54_039798, partial [Gekko kuhli]
MSNPPEWTKNVESWGEERARKEGEKRMVDQKDFCLILTLISRPLPSYYLVMEPSELLAIRAGLP